MNGGEVAIDLILETRALKQAIAEVKSQLGKLPSAVSIPDPGKGIEAYSLLGDVAQQTAGQLSSFLGGAVSGYREFGGALNQFSVFAGATAEETQALRDEALRLGAATSKAPGEIAAAAVAYTKLGVSADKAKDDLSDLVAISEATGAGMELSAEAVANASNVFDASTSEIAGTIVGLSNNTAAGVEDVNQLLATAGGVAKAAGQDFAEIGTAFGVLRNSGFSAETAATGVKIALERLKAPTGAAAKELEALGVPLRDAQGNLRPLNDLIPELGEALNAFAPEERDRITSAIFGSEGAPAFLTLANTTREELAALEAALREGGDPAATAAGLLQGLDGTLTLLSGSVQTATIAIGEALSPAINFAAKGALALINSFLSLPAPMQQFIVLSGAGVAVLTTLAGGLAFLEAIQIRQKLALIATTAAQLKDNAVRVASIAVAKSQALANLNVGNSFGALTSKIGGASLSFGTLSSKAGAVAKSTLEAAKSAAAAAAPTAALAGAAIALGLAYQSATAGIAIEAKLSEIAEGMAKTSEATNALADSTTGAGDRISASLQGGPINAIQSVQIEIARMVSAVVPGFKVSGDSASDYGAQLQVLGLNLRAVTVAQLANIRAQFGVNDVIAASNAAYDDGIDLIAQYGLTTVDASDKSRLGAQGIKEFSAAAREQIDALNSNIAALEEAAKAARTDSQREQIEAQIAAQTKQKSILEQRIALLNSDAAATEKNAASQKILATSLDSVTSDYQKAQGEIELASEQARTAIEESLARGTIDQTEAAKQRLAAEQESLSARLAANKDFVNSLRSVLEVQGADSEEGKKIQEELLAAEQEGQKLRTEIARNAGEQRKAIAEAEAAAQQAALDKASITAEKAKAVAAEQYAAGIISAEEYAAKRAQIELQGNRDRLALLQKQGGDEKEIQSLRTSIAEAEANARVEAERKALADIERANAEAEAVAAEQYAAGVISAEEYEAKRTQIEIQGNRDRLALLQKQGGDEKEIQSLRTSIAEAEAKARVEAERKALADIERANAEAEAAISQSVKARTLAVKQNVAAGLVDEKEAATQIAQIEAEATNATIAAAQKELAAVRAAKAAGIISAEAAAEREKTLQGEILDANLDRVEQQIAAQKALQEQAVAAIEEQLQVSLAALEEQKSSLSALNGLFEAQAGLLAAQNGLLEQRLSIAAEQAATETERAQIEADLARLREANLAKTQAAELQILKIKQQQAIIEQQVAIANAQAAVEKAKAAGASASEIAALEKALALQRQGLNFLQQQQALELQATQLQQQAQRERAAADVQAADRKVARARADEAAAAIDSRAAEVDLSAKARLADLEARAESGRISEAEYQAQKEQIEEEARKQRLALAQQELQQVQRFAAEGVLGREEAQAQLQKLRGSIIDLGGIDPGVQASRIAQQSRQLERVPASPLARDSELGGGLGAQLAELAAQVRGLNGNLARPNITVHTETPIEDLLAVQRG